MIQILCIFISCFSFATSPFLHDLNLCYTPGQSSEVMIVAHGMGGNYTLAQYLPSHKTRVSFNFPDHDYETRNLLAKDSAHGTIHEFLPLIYVLKQCILIDGHEKIDLYGFSAGGGAVVNTLAVLNSSRYEKELEQIGITPGDKTVLLDAIQKGMIILDTPLKSVREIVDFRGPEEDLLILAKNYEMNDMEPIDALKHLKGLALDVIVHFQYPDAILSNRDDDLFFTLLQTYNAKGVTKKIIGNEGRHFLPHFSLWDFYHQELSRSDNL